MAKAKRKRSTGAKKPVKKKRRVVRKRRVVAKRKPVKKRKRSQGRKLVKQVERRSVERVMAGKKPRRRRRSPRKRRVVMAGTSRRRRVSGNGGSGKMLMGLAIGAAAFYLLTRRSTQTTYPPNYQLPPLQQTGNYTRNTQSSDIVNYAVAGGLAIDAIIKLIEKLNTSSDQEVQNIYDVYHTNGVQGLEYYV